MNIILNMINLINNIEIIFTKKNIHSLSYVSIIQNKSKNIILYHNIYSVYLLWFYYIIGLFIKLKFNLIQCEEKNVIKISKFFSKTKHEIIIINDMNDVLTNYISELTSDQIIFFKKILSTSNSSHSNDDILFFKGITNLINNNNFTTLLLWEISYEGETAIDFFTHDGKYIF
jgi:hypothetical protein